MLLLFLHPPTCWSIEMYMAGSGFAIECYNPAFRAFHNSHCGTSLSPLPVSLASSNCHLHNAAILGLSWGNILSSWSVATSNYPQHESQSFKDPCDCLLCWCVHVYVHSVAIHLCLGSPSWILTWVRCIAFLNLLKQEPLFAAVGYSMRTWTWMDMSSVTLKTCMGENHPPRVFLFLFSAEYRLLPSCLLAVLMLKRKP